MIQQSNQAQEKNHDCLFPQLAKEAEHCALADSSQHVSDSAILKELELHHIMLGLQKKEIDRISQENESTRQRYLSLFAFSPTAFVTCNKEGVIIEANAAYYALITPAQENNKPQVENISIFNNFAEDDRHLAIQYLKNIFNDNTSPAISIRINQSNAKQHWIRFSAVQIKFLNAESLALVSLIELSIEQEQQKQSEALIRELNHRVKNSMGLVLSILQMESLGGQDSIDIRGIMIRVHALSKIYDQLYQKELSNSVDMSSYTHELFESLVLGFAGPKHNLSCFCKVEAFQLSAKRATSMGLIITELLSNALRHGFPQGFNGEIGLELSHDKDVIRCDIWNHGQKSLEADFAIQHHFGTGLQIVSHLSHQLNGTLHINTGIRPMFSLIFPLAEN